MITASLELVKLFEGNSLDPIRRFLETDYFLDDLRHYGRATFDL